MFKRKNKNRRVDWSQKKYGNPLFKQPASSRRASRSYFDNWQIKLLAIGAVSVIGGIIWLLFYSAVFRINTVEISGNERISKEELEAKFWESTGKKRWWFVRQNNLLAFDSEPLRQEFESSYVLDSLTIKKKPFHRMLIEIKEKDYGLIWHEGGAYYWINPDGTVIVRSDAPATNDSEKLPLIENEGDWVMINNRIEKQEEKINFVLKSNERLQSSQLKLKPEKFIISTSDDPSVKVVSPQMPLIIFNLKDDLDKQINRLVTLIKGMIKNDLSKKTRIDLRFGEKIFFE